ncbi:MarR family winged helix-turn-helix transcriptional regulator [Streptomyces sp. NPDC055013]
MSTHREAVDAVAVVEQTAESMIELWHRARRDIAPTISEQQMRALAVLAQKSCHLTALADRLGVSPSSATRMCNRLEARALVRRTVEGRHVRVSLTGSGRTVLEATRRRRRQLLEHALSVSPSPEQRLLRDALNLVCGFAGSGARVPGPRTPA